MRGPFILALDEGTSSVRSMIYDSRSRVVASVQREFVQHFPRPGWVEHDAQEIWRAQLSTARAVMRKARVSAEQIAAIGIANQRETVVVWDKRTGKPVHHAIVWQDRRTADACERLKARGLEREVSARTGLVLDPYFSATKIAWILDHVRGARARAQRGELLAGTMDTWLAWNLTGGTAHVTDPSNASRTMLFNLRTGEWDTALLRKLRIPRAMLPRIVPTSGVCGHAVRKHFGGKIPIAALVGDQQAALYGQLCVRPGMAKNTYGTGCFMLVNTGQRIVRSKNRLLTTVAWRIGRGALQYALEGSVFVGGAAVQWLRDGLGIIRASREIGPLAARVPNSGGVVMVPAFAGLGSPYWDSSARGLIIGITRGTTREHVARAALEGIAHQVSDLVGAMERDLGARMHSLRVDGGAAASDELMQIQADILGARIIRAHRLESTAFGAAALAGLGAGVWKSARQLERAVRSERTFAPRTTPAARRQKANEWKRAVARCRNWAVSEAQGVRA